MYDIRTELHQAITVRDKTEFQKLFDMIPADYKSQFFQTQNQSGITILHHLIIEYTRPQRASDHLQPLLEIAKLILYLMDPKDLTIQEFQFNQTALHRAIMYKTEILATEILNRMDPNNLGLQNSNGETHLDCAITQEMPQLAEKILDRMDLEGLSIQDVDDKTALDWAREKGFDALATKIQNRIDELRRS